MNRLTPLGRVVILLIFALVVGILLVVLPTPTPIVYLYVALTSVYLVDKFLQLA